MHSFYDGKAPNELASYEHFKSLSKAHSLNYYLKNYSGKNCFLYFFTFQQFFCIMFVF